MYKVLTTWPTIHICMIISLQPYNSTFLWCCHPCSSTSLKVNNRSFRYASPRLWNELIPKEFCQPADDKSLTLSSSWSYFSSSSPSSSPLSLCMHTPSLFHSRPKTYLLHKSMMNLWKRYVVNIFTYDYFVLSWCTCLTDRPRRIMLHTTYSLPYLFGLISRRHGFCDHFRTSFFIGSM